jgi:hypothetical protein
LSLGGYASLSSDGPLLIRFHYRPFITAIISPGTLKKGLKNNLQLRLDLSPAQELGFYHEITRKAMLPNRIAAISHI